MQAFAHHSTHSALEASTFHSLHTRFAHQLIAGASVEQNSIGHTQIIISQDFKWLPYGLLHPGIGERTEVQSNPPLCHWRFSPSYDLWLCFNSKKASNAVGKCQICKCSFSAEIGTGKLGRISTENQSQTSNREGSRATTLALNMCASLSPLLLRISLICAFRIFSRFRTAFDGRRSTQAWLQNLAPFQV